MLAAFALLAMVVRGVTPAGYMLAPTANHIAVTLCSGHGAVLDLDTGGLRDADQPAPVKPSHRDAPCVFAALAPLAAAESAAVLVVAQDVPVAITPRALQRIAPGRGLAAPPPPARGPPISV